MNLKQTDELVEIMMTQYGYDEESAIKVVAEVKGAMKTNRLRILQTYQNKRVLFECDGLQIEGFIDDVRVTEKGHEMMVRPVAGEKTKWITKFIKVL